MRIRSFSSSSPINIWPGFVDALSALILVMLFTFMVFIVSQFYLSDSLQTREKSLSELSHVIATLKKSLEGEKSKKNLLNEEIEGLKEENFSLVEALNIQGKELLRESQGREKSSLDLISLEEQVKELNLQLQQITSALESSTVEAEEKDLKIEELSLKLNQALQKKMKELSTYRSEFFEKLQKALGHRQEIHVVGDRFIFQAEVLFPLGSEAIDPSGQEELKKFAQILREISKKIPSETSWILRVDGHTDILPMKNSTNRKLSMARALSVVDFLIHEGIPPERLVPAGFGEFHPIDIKDSEESLARNRRIEFKLDQR